MARSAKPLLVRGDTVGVVATGFAVLRAALDAGVSRLERMGYRVRLGASVLARQGYLAGDDDARSADLNAMLRDPQVRAIWFARGGYGTARILERVDWRALAARPILLIGYSDLTALFAGAVERAGRVCLYGPVVAELADREAYDAASLSELLAGRPTTIAFEPGQVLARGTARGRLAGGNLTVLNHLCGTRGAPRLDGTILFLEDLGEEAYRIDRCLTQLRAAGAFRGVAGVLLGEFTVPQRKRFPPDRPVEDLFRETFLPLGVPVVCRLPAGHVRRKRTLPLGGRVELSTRQGRVRFLP